MRLTDPDLVVNAIHRFFDPLIVRGVVRTTVAPEPEAMAA
jgi:hypothetical protein